jgi:pimeloyl-ACP methyl ester carboxylesterase
MSEIDIGTVCDWTFSDAQGTVEQVKFLTGDGVELHGWWITSSQVANSSAPPPPLLYHHGSGVNLAAEYRLERYNWFLGMGISIFVYDYPGYGKSNGAPSEDSVNAAARAALTWLKTRTGKAENEIMQIGRSMGGAVAVRLAADLGRQTPAKAFKATILQSTFTTYADAAASGYPIAGWAVAAGVGPLFRSIDYVEHAGGCLFHYHGNDDEFVPVEQAKLLRGAGGWTTACARNLYTDTGLKHGDAMAAGQIAAIRSWMTAPATTGLALTLT